MKKQKMPTTTSLLPKVLSLAFPCSLGENTLDYISKNDLKRKCSKRKPRKSANILHGSSKEVEMVIKTPKILKDLSFTNLSYLTTVEQSQEFGFTANSILRLGKNTDLILKGSYLPELCKEMSLFSQLVSALLLGEIRFRDIQFSRSVFDAALILISR